MTASELLQDKKNYRRHSDENRRVIRKSIDECGLGRSVVVDADGVLIAGNGVASVVDKDTPVQVVETDGSTLVVVKRTDLHEGDVKRKKLALADNAASDGVEWDTENLCELVDFGIDVSEFGVQVDLCEESQSPDQFGTQFSLPDGEKQPYQQITFSLHDEQATIIKKALDDAKQMEEYKHMDTFGNTNSNGNALTFIVQIWAGARK